MCDYLLKADVLEKLLKKMLKNNSKWLKKHVILSKSDAKNYDLN